MPEISDKQLVSFLVQQEVFQLEVSVRVTLGVDVLYGFEHLLEELLCFLFSESMLRPQVVEQLAALGQVADDVARAMLSPGLGERLPACVVAAHPESTVVSQVTRNVEFAFEVSESPSFSDFESDFLLGLGVLSSKNVSGNALAKLAKEYEAFVDGLIR